MKASGSATSLTHLRDTGCIFCTEDEGEKGEQLVDSKHLCKCGCKFVTHLSCWNKNLECGVLTCPICSKPFTHAPPPILQTLGISGEESETPTDRLEKQGISMKTVGILLFCIACCVAFAIGIVVSFHT